MNATALFQAISQAIFISLIQALIIYLFVQFVLSAFKDLNASWRYNILYMSMFLTCAGFLVNIFSYYDSSVKDIPGETISGLLKQMPAAEALIPYSFWISSIYLFGLFYQTTRLLLGLYRLTSKRLKGSVSPSNIWSKRLEELKR